MKAQLERRSCRKFSRDPVPKADIEKIIQAGRNYACGMKLENINFVVVTNLEKLDKLSGILENSIEEFKGYLAKRKVTNKVTNSVWADAPLVIFLTYQTNENQDFGKINAGDAGINLISAATELGYGTLPVGMSAFPQALEPISAVLGVKPEQVGLSIAIGKKHPEWKNDTKRDLTQIKWIESSHDLSIASGLTTKSSFIDAINKRRSCRKFNPSKPVATKDLEQISLFAKSSPTGRDAQPFDILIVTKPEVIKSAAQDTFDSLPAEIKTKFGPSFNWESIFYHAPAVFFIYEARELSPDCTKWDLGIVTQSILNAASYYGYQATTIGLVTHGDSKKLKSDLGFPPESSVIAVIVGVPADDWKNQDRELKSTVNYVE